MGECADYIEVSITGSKQAKFFGPNPNKAAPGNSVEVSFHIRGRVGRDVDLEGRSKASKLMA